MSDRAHDGFTATMHGVQWATGAGFALLLAALFVLLVILLLDTLIGTVAQATRPWRLRRSWRRSGRTPSR